MSLEMRGKFGHTDYFYVSLRPIWVPLLTRLALLRPGHWSDSIKMTLATIRQVKA
jgi:hypothetical protein